MSVITDIRDAAENFGSIATAPFTFGQGQRLVSKSGQNSGLGNLSQHYSDIWRDVNIAGLVAGGAYLGAQALTAAPQIAGGAAPAAPGAVAPLAAEAAPVSTSQALAQGLVQGGEGAAATAPAAAAPTVDAAMGMPFTPGPGSVGAMDPSNAGLFTQGADWVQAHPIASLIGANMAGSAVKGYADLSAQRESDKRKAQAAQDLADLPRRTKQGNPSVGGGNVNLNLRPGGKVLKRPDGTTVFVPGTGIINGSMNGVRG